MNLAGAEFAACTIIAKNYLPMARVLTESWHRFHPGCPLFVLLLDSPSGFFSLGAEAFEPVLVPELDIPHVHSLLFKYPLLEAGTAVKPYFLGYLFRRYSPHKLLYLDADILILASLDGLKASLDTANVLLTPHLLAPAPADGQHEDDHDILKTGVYNLGFLGLLNGLESWRLLQWWCGKLYHHCIDARDANLFVDQRWMDLIPGLFAGVQILRDPGYNVARWNLHERAVSLEDGIKVNGGPLYFFHFSGFDPNKPWLVSKHWYRYDMEGIGAARGLYMRYRELLVEKGWNETNGWTYSHDFFGNGMRIPLSARRYYWSLGPDVSCLGNPFSWLGSGSRDLQIARTVCKETPGLLQGINLLGTFQPGKAVDEDVRSHLRIIRATAIPYVLNSCVSSDLSNIEPVFGKLSNDNPFLINLLTLNADGLQSFAKAHLSYLTGHFNIGCWTWDLAEFPREWTTAFGHVNEVWTPSEFTRNAVAACSPVPVKVVPHSIDPAMDFAIEGDRAKLELSADVFVFVLLCDFHCFVERQNPLSVIEAYTRAFGNRKDVQLLIHSSHSAEHKAELSLLQRASSGANVRMLYTVLTREARRQLMMSADCFVSLHRAEGFGMSLAEAMLCGKPVIATGYSGNVDFMSDDDSFLVPYRIVTIDRTHGPYKASYHWAEPDLDYACDFMRYVESHREAAAHKGLRAKAKIRESLHPATVAASVRNRLKELGLLGQNVSVPS